MFAIVSVKNCALPSHKFITYILYTCSIVYRSQYHRSFKFCVCCIFLYFNEWGRRSSWNFFWGRPMQKVGNRCSRSMSITRWPPQSTCTYVYKAVGSRLSPTRLRTKSAFYYILDVGLTTGRRTTRESIKCRQVLKLNAQWRLHCTGIKSYRASHREGGAQIFKMVRVTTRIAARLSDHGS